MSRENPRIHGKNILTPYRTALAVDQSHCLMCWEKKNLCTLGNLDLSSAEFQPIPYVTIITADEPFAAVTCVYCHRVVICVIALCNIVRRQDIDLYFYGNFIVMYPNPIYF